MNLAQDSGDDPTIMGSDNTFSMLNRDTFMVTSTRGSGSLKVYAISQRERAPPTHLATLHLPELQLEYHLRALDSHSGPIHAHPPENSHFTSSLESRIQVISAFYSGRTNHHYSIFIHNDQLLTIATSNPVGSDLLWPSWGPQHTRFLPACIPTIWLR